MTPAVIIRPFQPGDKPAVRRIFFETADAGRPGQQLLPDPDLAMDFWTLYYTDFEPESLWVAETEGQVSGYLMGCVSDRLFIRKMVVAVVPAILWRGLKRGSFFKIWLWKFIFINAPKWLAMNRKPDESADI